MEPTHTHLRLFGRGDSVLEYWLAHAEGFRVRSGSFLRERVEEVVLEPGSGRAGALVLCSPLLGRRRTVPAFAVAASEPRTKTLVLDRRDQAPRTVLDLRSPVVRGAATASGPRGGRDSAPDEV